MIAARYRSVSLLHRLLCVRDGAWSDHLVPELPELLQPGDLLVLNDAATLPASLPVRLGAQSLELRLVGPPEAGWAILFGPGSWRQPTEERPPPPIVAVGESLQLGGASIRVEEVSARSPRLIRLTLPPSLVWRLGRPIQYSYLDRELSLSEVQTSYGTRPWAVEMPSAGRPLTATLRRQLLARGVQIAALTHAAGLSSTGDAELDAALPLPERYEVPDRTWRAVTSAARVIAVGTSAVRALESAARGPLAGITELRLGPDTSLQVVDGLLSGMHEPGEPHFQMMGAFADPALLRAAVEHAGAVGYHNHEFGDSTLLLR